VFELHLIQNEQLLKGNKKYNCPKNLCYSFFHHPIFKKIIHNLHNVNQYSSPLFDNVPVFKFNMENKILRYSKIFKNATL
jgi:hypothetical protein